MTLLSLANNPLVFPAYETVKLYHPSEETGIMAFARPFSFNFNVPNS